jgi:predicted methyltransferase
MATPLRVRLATAAALLCLSSVSAAAQVAARPAEDQIRMLDSPNRVASLRVDDVISRLGLRPGHVVADLGAGTGVFSLAVSRLVGPSGKVYSVEVAEHELAFVVGAPESVDDARERDLLTLCSNPSNPWVSRW